jgi:hypothetical protein
MTNPIRSYFGHNPPAAAALADESSAASRWFLPDLGLRRQTRALREPSRRVGGMPMSESSILAVLEDRPQQQPEHSAFTFIDYEVSG